MSARSSQHAAFTASGLDLSLKILNLFLLCLNEFAQLSVTFITALLTRASNALELRSAIGLA